MTKWTSLKKERHSHSIIKYSPVFWRFIEHPSRNQRETSKNLEDIALIIRGRQITQSRLKCRKIFLTGNCERQTWVETEISDPWRFFYMYPDPRIRTTGLRIRILLFSSVVFSGTFTFDNKLLRSHKTVNFKVFLQFLLVIGRTRIRKNNYGSGKLSIPTDPEHRLKHFFLAR